MIRSALPGRTGGFTLVEVLVTLVLISVGLLGVAALQLTTLQNNLDAYVRSQASALASDILDRMRANPVSARNGDYHSPTFGATGVAGTVANTDLVQWQANLAATLPGGTGRVLLPNTAARVATVEIQWQERGTALTFRSRTEI